MKITVNLDPSGQCQSLRLTWQMPKADRPTSLYILPAELTPTQYPHAVKDLSRIAVFYGDHFVLFHAPDHGGNGQDGTHRSEAHVIHCNTFKLLEVLRKLHDAKVAKTVLDTDRFCGRKAAPPLLTIGQLASHPNLQDRQRLGKTLKHFWSLLSKGTERTFADLMRDLSYYVHCAHIYANDDEFYFNGRIPNGCGFNGGILPHVHQHSYGIHT